ncbi:MAG: PAS domain-containing protein [Planctomycetes bacterium]|nr:PAS domain-containing protein [Planctomycetota bacterium]
MKRNEGAPRSSVPPHEKGQGITPAAKVVLLAAGSVVAIFGAYEVIERLWLTHVDMETLHLLHMARGVLSTLVAAAAVYWLLSRTPFLLLAKPFPIAGASQSSAHSADEEPTSFSRWFIQMRWVAVGVASFLVVAAVKLFKLLPEDVWWPLVGILLALALSNLYYASLLRRGKNPLAVQAYADLVFLHLLLHYSGGIENPLALIAIFHVIMGGILLTRRQCYLVAGVAAALFSVMAVSEWNEWLAHYTLLIFPHGEGKEIHAAHETIYVFSRVLLQSAILLLVAFFITGLAERARLLARKAHEMAEQVLAEHNLLEQALQSAGVGIRVLEREVPTAWCNDQWSRWFEDHPSETGRAADVGGENDLPARKTLEDGSARTGEIVVQSAKGARHILQVTAVPIRDDRGTVRRVAELAMDVTEQKEAQKQIIRAGQLATVGELAGYVAHEVNNPTAVISGKARLLLSNHREEMSAGVADEIGKMVELSERVTGIAQNLLSYCRPFISARMPLDIRLVIRKALAMVEQRAKTGGVRLAETASRRLPPVRGSMGELEQVFLNLFLNALDAMPGGGCLTVEAISGGRLNDGSPCLSVNVDDTGAGIPEGIRDRIFEPFFTTKTASKGTGLGLAICRNIVHSHGGDIEAVNLPRRGARFTVRLPLRKEADRG